jgi:hypothetical protein
MVLSFGTLDVIPEKCLPFEDKDNDDGDDNVFSPAAFVGDAQEPSEHFTLQLKRKRYY